MTIPVYSVDLIKALLAAFPPTTPKLDQSEREIFFQAGKADLVQMLKTSLDLQQEDEETHHV